MMPLHLPKIFILLASFSLVLCQSTSEENEQLYLDYPRLGVEANVTCGGRAIEITVSQQYLKQNERWLGHGQWLRLSGSDCRSTVLPNGDAQIKIDGDFSGCGNKIAVIETISASGTTEITKSYKFSNLLISESGNEQVSRQMDLFKFDCIYPAIQLVSPIDSQVDIHVIQIDKISGEMIVHKSKSLSETKNISTNPDEVISVQIAINEPQLAGISNVSLDFVTVVESCWVSVKVEKDFSNVSLIANGCPVNENVQILSNSESLAGRFSMRVFSFLKSGKDPVLHCLVKICNRTSTDGCLPTCNSKRKKRSLFDIDDAGSQPLRNDREFFSNEVNFFVKSTPREMMCRLPLNNETVVFKTIDNTINTEKSTKREEGITLTSAATAEQTLKGIMPTQSDLFVQTSDNTDFLIPLYIILGTLLLVFGMTGILLWHLNKARIKKWMQQKHVRV